MSEKNATVLLVDDDPDFLFQIESQLKANGYAVETAEGPAEAEEKLAHVQADIAIVDLMMDEMDAGFSLCHSLKKQYPDMPIIMCTGVMRETGLAFDAGTSEERSWVKADAMLAKPVRFEQLRREIERLLKS